MNNIPALNNDVKDAVIKLEWLRDRQEKRFGSVSPEHITEIINLIQSYEARLGEIKKIASITHDTGSYEGIVETRGQLRQILTLCDEPEPLFYFCVACDEKRTSDEVDETGSCKICGGVAGGIYKPEPCGECGGSGESDRGEDNKSFMFKCLTCSDTGEKRDEPKAECFDCQKPYDKYWVDVVIPNEVWNQITPENGLLCFGCMTKRLMDGGFKDVPVIVGTDPYKDDNEEWRLIGIKHGQEAKIETLLKEKQDEPDLRDRMRYDIANILCCFKNGAYDDELYNGEQESNYRPHYYPVADRILALIGGEGDE